MWENIYIMQTSFFLFEYHKKPDYVDYDQTAQSVKFDLNLHYHASIMNVAIIVNP